MDLTSASQQPITIKAGEIQLVPTAIAIALTEFFEAQIRPRSGLAKYGITVANSPGTIDADYRGEIKVILINLGKEDFTIEKGCSNGSNQDMSVSMKSEMLEGTVCGSGGFGSTGV